MGIIDDYVKQRMKEDHDKRYTYYGKYKIDRLLLFSALVIFIFYSVIVWTHQSEFVYFKCDAVYPDICHNPFYAPQMAWRLAENLTQGEYGNRDIDRINHNSLYFLIFVLAIAFALNHFFHNTSNSDEVN